MNYESKINVGQLRIANNKLRIENQHWLNLHCRGYSYDWIFLVAFC